jgi:alpha-L-fucosidase
MLTINTRKKLEVHQDERLNKRFSDLSVFLSALSGHRSLDFVSTLLILFLFLSITSCRDSAETFLSSPVEPVPSERQLAWHELEYYAFIHFGINTFTGDEWGYGDKSPELFNPTDFDADETVRLFRDAGMSAVILTVKHHDGFCLWPSEYTEYSVKNSPWREGGGDIVREFAEACKRYDMKFGIYLSPWDRNHPDYGKPEYNKYYLQQLEELLTEYGEIVEVWFDGARGDEGYYGGAREKRVIDPVVYYDWNEYRSLVRRLQPDAVMFSDVGPDIRWVGNEEGFAGETNWAMYTPAPREGTIAGVGNTKYLDGLEGHRDGEYWMPAECPVSIRPGWFYHEKEDDLVKSPGELLDLYFKSVGRNAALLLNIPPDRRGRIAEPDRIALMDFKRLRDQLFADDYAKGAVVSSSNVRGNNRRFDAMNVIDGDRRTYWATDDTVTEASMVIALQEPVTFDVLMLQEYIPLGQRVESFYIEQWDGSEWIEIVTGTTIGYKRLLRFQPVTTDSIRLVIHNSRAAPLISAVSIYKLPL